MSHDGRPNGFPPKAPPSGPKNSLPYRPPSGWSNHQQRFQQPYQAGNYQQRAYMAAPAYPLVAPIPVQFDALGQRSTVLTPHGYAPPPPTMTYPGLPASQSWLPPPPTSHQPSWEPPSRSRPSLPARPPSPPSPPPPPPSDLPPPPPSPPPPPPSNEAEGLKPVYETRIFEQPKTGYLHSRFLRKSPPPESLPLSDSLPAIPGSSAPSASQSLDGSPISTPLTSNGHSPAPAPRELPPHLQAQLDAQSSPHPLSETSHPHINPIEPSSSDPPSAAPVPSPSRSPPRLPSPPPPPPDPPRVPSWKVIYDPAMPSSARGPGKGKEIIKRYDGVVEGQEKVELEDPRLAMSKYEREAGKGSRKLRSNFYQLSYTWDKNSNGPPPEPPATAILVTQLAPLTTVAQIQQFFSSYGRMADVDVKLDPSSGSSLCVCWIKFVGPRSGKGDAHQVAKDVVARCSGKSISGGVEAIKIVLDAKGEKAKKAAEEEIERRRPKPKPTLSPFPPLVPTPPPSYTPQHHPSSSSHNAPLPSVPNLPAPPAPATAAAEQFSQRQPYDKAAQAARIAKLTADLQAQSRGQSALPRNPSIPNASYQPQHALPKPPHNNSSPSWIPSSSQLPINPNLHQLNRPPFPRNPLPPTPTVHPSAFAANPFDSLPPNPASHAPFHLPPHLPPKVSSHVPPSFSKHTSSIAKPQLPDPQRGPSAIALLPGKSALSRRDEPDCDHYVPVYSDESASEEDMEIDGDTSLEESLEPPQEKGETLTRLRQNGRPYISIAKESLPIVGKRSVPLVEVRRHFEKFQVSEVMKDSEGWSILFLSSTSAARCQRVLDGSLIRIHRISLSVQQPLPLASAVDKALSKEPASLTAQQESKKSGSSIAQPSPFDPDEHDDPLPPPKHADFAEINFSFKKRPGAISRKPKKEKEKEREPSRQPSDSEGERCSVAPDAAPSKSRSRPKEKEKAARSSSKGAKKSKEFIESEDDSDAQEPVHKSRRKKASKPAFTRDFTPESEEGSEPESTVVVPPRPSVDRRSSGEEELDVDLPARKERRSSESEGEEELGIVEVPSRPSPPVKGKEKAKKAPPKPRVSKKPKLSHGPSSEIVPPPTDSGVEQQIHPSVRLPSRPSSPLIKPSPSSIHAPLPSPQHDLPFALPNGTSPSPIPEHVLSPIEPFSSSPPPTPPHASTSSLQPPRPPKPSKPARAHKPPKAPKEKKSHTRREGSSSFSSSILDPIALGIAEDEEDLYLLRLISEKARKGTDANGSDDDEDGDERHRSSSNPAPFTSCMRIEGYRKTTELEKSRYLPQRNRAVVDVSTSKPVNAVASGRSNRVNTRRLVQGMEQHKKAAASDTDILKFNQLRTRKKQLKFGKSPIHDWGLYAMESIPAHDMVIEYVGEVIRAAVADKREKYYERIGIGSSYLFRVDEESVIDATKKGNLGRLINHCCTPNCTAKIITINGEKKIVIYAKSNIEAGDEITYDYHFPLEQEKIVCLCGSPKCRGFLN